MTMGKENKLDRIDRRILSTLQKDGRISNVALAKRANLSPSACLQRVKRLEQRGFITGYHANVSLKQISQSVSVIALITLQHDKENFIDFEKIVKETPDIIECLKVSGEFDYQVRFECRDMETYHNLTETLLNRANGITNLSSHVILQETKSNTGVVLDHLLE